MKRGERKTISRRGEREKLNGELFFLSYEKEKKKRKREGGLGGHYIIKPYRAG